MDAEESHDTLPLTSTHPQVAQWLYFALTPILDEFCYTNMSATFVDYYDIAKAQGREFRTLLGLPEECKGPNDFTCGTFFCYYNTSYIVLMVRSAA